MFTRRGLVGAAAVLAGASAMSGRAQAASLPEAPTTTTNTMQSPLFPATGPDYQPVITLNGWTLPWRMNGDWKEFHLVAEPVEREFAPGMTAHCGATTARRRGRPSRRSRATECASSSPTSCPSGRPCTGTAMLLPNGMDGVGGLTQPHIEPGKTYVYEFALRQHGTLMYHPHSDEMVQMAMGMMGMFIVHPRDLRFRRVDRDFVFMMSAYAIDPGTSLPRGRR